MNIEEKKQVVSTMVQQAGLVGQKARVILGVDHSASIEDLDEDGSMQSIVESCAAIAFELDSDGQLEVIAFSDDATMLSEPVTKDNYVGYVNRNIRNLDYGGTAYAPVINAVIKATGATQQKEITYMKKTRTGGFLGWGGKDTSKETKEIVFIHPTGKTAVPTLLLLITDGDNDTRDKSMAKNYFIQSSKHPIFVACLGVQGVPKPDFKFLKELDTMNERFLDNVSFSEVSASKLKSMDPKEFMKSVLGEFLTSYIPVAKKQRLITV